MRACLFGFALVALVSCGGNEPPPCELTPCGGSPVGQWRLTSACGAATLGNACMAATIKLDLPSSSGEATLNADMTFTSNLMTTGTASIGVPGSCLSSASNCGQLSGALEQEDVFSDVRCGGDIASACTCTAMAQQTIMDSGTYTVAGDQLTLMGMAMPSALTNTFCQQGNSLKVKTRDGLVFTFTRK